VRVLVLGGTRFIGPHVVRLLAEAGNEVTIFHRGETESDLPDVRHVHGDFRAFTEFVDDLCALQPDVVLDMVPSYGKSGQGLKHFRGVAARGVAITSADVYRAFARLWRSEPGPPDPLPLTEDSPLRSAPGPDRVDTPGIEYDNVETERELAGDPELPIAILRLPATHGPGDPHHRLFRYLKRMQDQRAAILLDSSLAGWRWVRGYVEDVAHAIALAVTDDRAAGRTYNVAHPNAHPEAEWVRRIADVFGWQGEIVPVPSERLPESLRWDFDADQDFVVASNRIRNELGFAELCSEQEGLRRTADWELANPPAEIDSSEFDYAAEDEVLAGLTG
jgi:nucleoside-diphosphate-sugar epimerase